MASVSSETPANHPLLPREILDAIGKLDTRQLFNELSESEILAPAELMVFRRELTSLLKNVWYDRNCSPNRLFASSVSPEKQSAALWKIEEIVLTPLMEKLRDAGLGNDDVLFQQGDFVLTAARCSGHTTDRISIKSQNAVQRKRFLKKPMAVTEIVLDVDYPEQGRFGEYETLHLDLTAEEVLRFREALSKATMIGCFNGFLGRMRTMV